MSTQESIALEQLIALLSSKVEFAFIDVREAVPVHHSGSPLVAVHIPLSKLEPEIVRLVPRRATPIVLTDGGGDEQTASRAAAVLRAGGYESVRVLTGGTAAWRAAGYELFAGANALGQAFGEFIEEKYHTPHIAPAELVARLERGEPITLLDSRPLAEFEVHSLPGARSAPGAELVHRAQAAAASDASLVVVNCAGRTRAILGAQALITAGVSKTPVVALENGTQGWLLAGAQLNHGLRDELPVPQSSGVDATALAARLGVRIVSTRDVSQLQRDAQRTVYLFDIRTPEEYSRGHYRGARSAPSWDLVPWVFRHAATRNAQLVLIDDATAERAVISAWWLKHLGWGEVSVLAGWPEADTTVEPTVDQPIHIERAAKTIDVEQAAQRIAAGQAVVIDVGSSVQYRQRRVPGAWFAVRSHLPRVLDSVPDSSLIIVTSDDGKVAAYAAAELAELTRKEVLVLSGGTAAWFAAGKPTDSGPGLYLTGAVDWPGHAWYLQGEQQLAGFRKYLAWEIALTEQIRRDVTSPFRVPEAPEV